MIRRLAPALALGASCGKVPISGVEAGFVTADAAWFAEEETLFLFAEVRAEQGIEAESIVEVTWTTDAGEVDWTPLDLLPPVHQHVPVDCGPRAICTSASVAVALEPRNVRLRLRYHRDGELALYPDTAFDVVGPGPAAEARSLVVYGVLNSTNDQVQWRSRHQFPRLHNEEVERLGLRRAFRVADPRYGALRFVPNANPYGYGLACPDFVPTGGLVVETNERGVWAAEELPDPASERAMVCADATVTDALGEFTTRAIARKNPEVRQAFSSLHSPIEDAVQLGFFLAPCRREIDADHAEMQRQRLQLEGVPTTCIDDWREADFVDTLVAGFREAVEAQRPAGRDMVLVIAVHHDEPAIPGLVEEALRRVVPRERSRTTPRLAGAFVLDSDLHAIGFDALEPVVLWCPAEIPLSGTPDVSVRSCGILPDNPNFELGPFSFGALPILPTRDQYVDFVDTYSKAQAGEVVSLRFLTPEFSATAEHVELGDFGNVTFLDGEQIAADPNDAFSWCPPDVPVPFVFSSRALDFVARQSEDGSECAYLGLPADACDELERGMLPLELLPQWHQTLPERVYDLGVFWEFPYLLRMRYEEAGAGAVGAFGFTVPFGISNPATSYSGAAVWEAEDLPLDALTQCDRFCDHPTFDSAGIYHPHDRFRSTYQQACYAPRYPTLGDDPPEPGSGFPRDP